MKKCKFLAFCVTALFAVFFLGKVFLAYADTDKLNVYEITVKVNDDGTLSMDYHLEWEVLESDSAGALSWVKIGIPNNHVLSYEPKSDVIKKMSISKSGGTYAEIHFKKKYYKGDVVSFDFHLEQDYMYEMNMLTDGETVFEFTPGWFDEMRVEKLTIRWKSENVTSISPSALHMGNYYIWITSLKRGGKYKISVTYPNDAYNFNKSKTIKQSSYSSGSDDTANIVGLVMLVGIMVMLVGVVKSASRYNSSAALAYDTKVTRTRIEYWPTCQGCGGTRKEGEEKCAYCGRSFVKSEEVITEKTVPKGEEDALKYKENGTYRVGTNSNVFVRVNVTRTPRPVTTHHSSCAHSSCACACACACAGGGRAGCSTKDFYNTNLKLRFFERFSGKTKKKNNEKVLKK